jgi:hypothetical protein
MSEAFSDKFYHTFFCGGYWDLKSGFALARQVLYHLSQTSNPFYSLI